MDSPIDAFFAAPRARPRPLSLRFGEADDAGQTWELDVPGVKRDDISVEAARGILFVKAKRKEETIERTVVLPDDCDDDGISVRLEDGVLYVHIPFKRKARKIEVE